MRKRREHKNFFWAFLFFLPLILFINIFSPVNSLSFFVFYMLLFLFLCKLFSLFLPFQESVLFALTVICYLLLKQLGSDNILNVLLLSSIAITLTVYFRKS